MPLVATRGNAGVFGLGWGAAAGGAADAMTAIASNTLVSDAASVTFTSIPSDYDDLMVSIYVRAETAGQNLYARFNSDAGSNYSGTFLNGNGSSATSNSRTNASSLNVEYNNGILNGTNTFSSLTFHILNYANTSYYKTGISRHAGDNNGSGGTELCVQLWRSTSAISSIQFNMSSGNLRTGSVFALYGIKKAD